VILEVLATSSRSSKLAILDRDGTLIDFFRDPELGVVTPAFHPSHVRLLPGVLEGLALLRDAGFALAVASNQPGAAKGELPEAAIRATQRHLTEHLAELGVPLAAIATCLHHPSGGDRGRSDLTRPCDCRKPAPGMLRALLEAAGAAPDRSFMIGDTPTDVAAGRAAGVATALLLPAPRCELCPQRGAIAALPSVPSDLTAPRLDRLAELIVANA
jgi:D-glycero-D-manno-heptose 1,7-bisphosphate phosphatase